MVDNPDFHALDDLRTVRPHRLEAFSLLDDRAYLRDPAHESFSITVLKGRKNQGSATYHMDIETYKLTEDSRD